MSTTPSLYWFDYETFGTAAAWDKPAQFAGVRTDLALNPIGEPLLIYCRPPDDYLPHPGACRVTGMHPSDIAKRGLPEAQFIAQVLEQLGAPGTCSVGYNSIRFDDEFTRHTLFRNFFDPYEYEWKDGNSRWDLLDVVRLTRALRPAGINWPCNEDGTPSNRLEHLTAANNIEHGNAHDALSDVYATIGVARLLKSMQPKLYDYAFNKRDKQSVAEMLNVRTRKPCLHISGMVPNEFSHTSIVIPIVRHSVNKNSIIVLDLRTNPAELLPLSEADIAERVFTSSDNLPEGVERLHLRTIQINRCPVLAPINTLQEKDAQRLGINLEQQLNYARQFEQMASKELEERISNAMTRTFESSTSDVDGSLYGGGFFSAEDKKLFAEIRRSEPTKLAQFSGQFDDVGRLNDMLFRYRARNYPDSLTADEQAQWLEHKIDRLLNQDTPWLNKNSFEQAMNDEPWQPSESELREDLRHYGAQIISALSETS